MLIWTENFKEHWNQVPFFIFKHIYIYVTFYTSYLSTNGEKKKNISNFASLRVFEHPCYDSLKHSYDLRICQFDGE